MRINFKSGMPLLEKLGNTCTYSYLDYLKLHQDNPNLVILAKESKGAGCYTNYLLLCVLLATETGILGLLGF